MEPRKIIKFGNSSYVVTLPFEWVEKQGLHKGDTLNLFEKDDSILISMKKDKVEKVGRIEFDGKPLKLFNKELLSFYLKNYNKIEIVGSDVISKLDQIRVFKEKLSSVEITEIAKDKIVLKDLSSPSELDLCKLIKDIVEMEKIIFEELSQENFKEKFTFIQQLDVNINKLAFLAQKTIHYNLDTWINPQEVKDAIHYWRIVSTFENIGDIMKRIARYLKNESNEHNHFIALTLKDVSKYFDFVTSLMDEEINFDNNLKLYLDKKQSLLRDLESLREKLHDDLNLFLVITQLLKDIVGHLDMVIISTIDLKLK